MDTYSEFEVEVSQFIESIKDIYDNEYLEKINKKHNLYKNLLDKYLNAERHKDFYEGELDVLIHQIGYIMNQGKRDAEYHKTLKEYSNEEDKERLIELEDKISRLREKQMRDDENDYQNNKHKFRGGKKSKRKNKKNKKTKRKKILK